MTLINCPECKKEISDRSKWCVHCGYPLQSDLYQTEGMPKLLSVSDMKRIFRCSTKVVNDLLKTPEFPKIQVGDEYYIPKNEFEEWIEEEIRENKSNKPVIR